MTSLFRESYILIFLGLLLIGLFLHLVLKKRDQPTLHSMNLKSNSFFEYEFLGKVQKIHPSANGKEEGPSKTEIEILNLDREARLKVEKMIVCQTENPLEAALHTEKILNVLWEAKESERLVKILYPSSGQKCIRSAKISQPPKN